MSAEKGCRGKTLTGGYEFQDIEGAGRSSVVLRAKDPITGIPVAVKLFDPVKVTRHDAEKQAEIHLRLHHRNITGLHRQGIHTVSLREELQGIDIRKLKLRITLDPEEEAQLRNLIHRLREETQGSDSSSDPLISGMPFHILEYADSGDLRTRIQTQGELSPEEVISYTEGITNGLQEMHNLGFIHGDVKPANILLDQRSNPNGMYPIAKLTDFGSARILRSGTVQGSVSTGTPAYMAREHMEGKPNEKSDQFSVGAITFEMLTNTEPFTDTATLERFVTPGKIAVPLLRERRGGKSTPIHDALDPVLAQAMADDQNERFDTVEEYGATLRDTYELAKGKDKGQKVIDTGSAWKELRSEQARIKSEQDANSEDLNARESALAERVQSEEDRLAEQQRLQDNRDRELNARTVAAQAAEAGLVQKERELTGEKAGVDQLRSALDQQATENIAESRRLEEQKRSLDERDAEILAEQAALDQRATELAEAEERTRLNNKTTKTNANNRGWDFYQSGKERLLGKTLIGGYPLKKLIGEGGHNFIYESEDPHDKSIVVVRLSKYPQDDEGVDVSREQARRIASIHQKNILPINWFDVQEESFPFTVVPYANKGSLREYINTLGSIPFGERLKLLIHASDGLAEAHKQGVIHGDIKPENFLIHQKDGSLNLLVSDFGKPIQGRALQRNSIIGTPPYMAPEAPDQETDYLSDIYSLGIVAFELFTGKTPSRESMTFVDAGLGMTNILKELEAIVRKAINVNPKYRQQTMEDLGTDLRRIYAVLRPEDSLTLLKNNSLSPKSKVQYRTPLRTSRYVVDVPPPPPPPSDVWRK